jgi:hypothetical protein
LTKVMESAVGQQIHAKTAYLASDRQFVSDQTFCSKTELFKALRTSLPNRFTFDDSSFYYTEEEQAGAGERAKECAARELDELNKAGK